MFVSFFGNDFLFFLSAKSYRLRSVEVQLDPPVLPTERAILSDGLCTIDMLRVRFEFYRAVQVAMNASAYTCISVENDREIRNMECNSF